MRVYANAETGVSAFKQGYMREYWAKEIIKEDRGLRKLGLATGFADDLLRDFLIIEGAGAEEVDSLAAACLGQGEQPRPHPPEENIPF